MFFHFLLLKTEGVSSKEFVVTCEQCWKTFYFRRDYAKHLPCYVRHSSVLAILVTVTIVGMLTISTQQVFAPRNCGSCAEFQKLTDEFENKVLDIAANNGTAGIQKLLDEYNDDVKALFEIPSSSR
jgi:hypothetical protein